MSRIVQDREHYCRFSEQDVTLPCLALPCLAYLEAVSRTSSWGLLDGVSDTGCFIVFSYFFLLSVATVTLDDQPVRVMPRKSGREMLVHCDLRGHPRDPHSFVSSATQHRSSQAETISAEAAHKQETGCQAQARVSGCDSASLTVPCG